MASAIIDSLFDQLDLNRDGRVSRTELHTAARQLNWYWREAPILALLDLLAIHSPISHQRFSAIVQQVREDPLGPYGKVLLNAPHFAKKPRLEFDHISSEKNTAVGAGSSNKQNHWRCRSNHSAKELLAVIQNSFGKKTATQYRKWSQLFASTHVAASETAMLIIDPQRSFTRGIWMQSIGDGAAIDVAPIAIAFKNCRGILEHLYGRMDIMFSRCPFPPGSYDWDDELADIIDGRQPYFIKPGNSILFPPFNGFKEWLYRRIEQGMRTLVIGGCTLNSCVRVSAIEIRRHFENKNLRIMVDLSLCGARLQNYKSSPSYKGVSAVASAANQMQDAGVNVVRRVKFR